MTVAGQGRFSEADYERAKVSRFTSRLEPALRRIARGTQRLSTAAAAQGVAEEDLLLWVEVFAGGDLKNVNEARIEQVKRDVGVVVVRRLTPEEKSEGACRVARNQAIAAKVIAEKAQAEAALVARRAEEKREREERRKARQKEKSKAATEKQAPAEKQSADTVSLPWRKIGTAWILSTVELWRAELEQVARGTSVAVILKTLTRRQLVNFCTFRLRYFGDPEKLTAQTAADLLAFVRDVKTARDELAARRGSAPDAVAVALAKVRAALMELECVIQAKGGAV